MARSRLVTKRNQDNQITLETALAATVTEAIQKINRTHLKNKSVVPNIDRANEYTFQDLIILLILRRANIYQLPLQICRTHTNTSAPKSNISKLLRMIEQHQNRGKRRAADHVQAEQDTRTKFQTGRGS